MYTLVSFRNTMVVTQQTPDVIIPTLQKMRK